MKSQSLFINLIQYAWNVTFRIIYDYLDYAVYIFIAICALGFILRFIYGKRN